MQAGEVQWLRDLGKRGGCERHPALADTPALRAADIAMKAAALALARLSRENAP